MKLIEPSCEYQGTKSVITHIADVQEFVTLMRKIQILMKRQEALVKRLIGSGHVSMLRHATLYYIVPLKIFKDINNIVGQAIK